MMIVGLSMVTNINRKTGNNKYLDIYFIEIQTTNRHKPTFYPED